MKGKIKLGIIILLSVFLFSSCKEYFSEGERVGLVTKFSKAGVIWDSWDGLLNITQTGMNSSGEPFEFSLDNDRTDQQAIIDTLSVAQVKGYKVKLKYHQVWGVKNIFNNRGESDYFIDDIQILDRDFVKQLSSINKKDVSGQVIDTVWVVIDKSELRKYYAKPNQNFNRESTKNVVECKTVF